MGGFYNNSNSHSYIGRSEQLYGVTEARLSGGYGDGMRILLVRNGSGLEFVISLDRAADVSRLLVNGENMGYFAPCGYVAPQYYDDPGAGFLKSFTAGFFTTCGLQSVGNPCEDEGEYCPTHGTVSNIPCEWYSYEVTDREIRIRTRLREAWLFSKKLMLEREYVCPLFENRFTVTDKITNIGTLDCPLELLYHCNMGYPLLDENAVVTIPAEKVTPRNAHAAEGLENCLVMEKPQRGYEEKCYYHTLRGKTEVSVENPRLGRKVSIRYNADELPFFTEWKMMGEQEYVLGLEPGNCHPDGRQVMREQGKLEILPAGGEKVCRLEFLFQ